MKADTGDTSAAEPESEERRRLWSVIAALPYLLPVGLLLILAASIALLAVGAYTQEWKWSGFLDKKLWDWMELLIVPVFLALGGLFITQMDRLNSSRTQQLDRARLELERKQTSERLDLSRMQTQEQMEQARSELEMARRGQITERFTQAIDQLGSERLQIRLGGVYGLERIAQEDRHWHWQIMEVLSTYVRMYQRRGPDKKLDDEALSVVPYLEPDIQAILTVMGRRTVYHRDVELGPIDLRNTELSGADLRDADLQGADLSSVDFSQANCSGANLSGTNLEDAILTEADFTGANLRDANLERADLIRTDLRGAHLLGAYGLHPEQIEHAYGARDTQLPTYLEAPAHWGR